MEGVSWLCFSSHFRVLGNKRSSLSKGYTSIDHGCEDGLDGIWNEARDQIMKIDSHHEQLFSDRRTRDCDGEDVCRRLAGLYKRGRLGHWVGSVVGQVLHKGMFRERDLPSQMKHAELKNRPFLFRVSF